MIPSVLLLIALLAAFTGSVDAVATTAPTTFPTPTAYIESCATVGETSVYWTSSYDEGQGAVTCQAGGADASSTYASERAICFQNPFEPPLGYMFLKNKAFKGVGLAPFYVYQADGSGGSTFLGELVLDLGDAYQLGGCGNEYWLVSGYDFDLTAVCVKDKLYVQLSWFFIPEQCSPTAPAQNYSYISPDASNAIYIDSLVDCYETPLSCTSPTTPKPTKAKSKPPTTKKKKSG